MKKLLTGIRQFHEHLRPAYKERFAHLALGQSPDCFFVACSDSRVVPNLFASTEPGDLFVHRNVGNIVPPLGGEVGAGAALEFATIALEVGDIVVCGHSSCGAMSAIHTGSVPPHAPSLARWLEIGGTSKARLAQETRINPRLSPADRLSRANVLAQLDHLRTYPVVAEREAKGRLRLHAWWFDLSEVAVLRWDPDVGDFVPLVR